jgi:hypothetical protein
MSLRAIVNSNGVVIADGTFEFSNAGDAYVAGSVSGTWDSFSYDSYPDITSDILDWIATQPTPFFPLCFQSVSGAIVLRDLADIQANPNG